MPREVPTWRGAGKSPPHPATVQRKRGSVPAGSSPHPATVVLPKAPHAATVVKRLGAAAHAAGSSGSTALQRMVMKTDVAGWTFTQFKRHVDARPKRGDEDWTAYEGRLRADFDNFDGAKQGRFLTSAIERQKRLQAPPPTPKGPPKKRPISSDAYVFTDGRWRLAKIQELEGGAKGRRTTSDHVEQDLYSKMWWGKTAVWIGFVQNEFPCHDYCVDYFKTISRGGGVLGVIFSVVDSGDYATAHGFKRGDSATVYFYDGKMSYEAPEGAEAPAPP